MGYYKYVPTFENRQVTMKAKKNINHPDYLRVIEQFNALKALREVPDKTIEDATRTGSGRMSRFRHNKYKPGLLTFVQWCHALGIRITLSKGRMPNLKKLIAEANKPDPEDPASIIDEIRLQQNKK